MWSVLHRDHEVRFRSLSSSTPLGWNKKSSLHLETAQASLASESTTKNVTYLRQKTS